MKTKEQIIVPLPIYTYRQQKSIEKWLDRHGIEYEVNHCDGSITVTMVDTDNNRSKVLSKTLLFLGY